MTTAYDGKGDRTIVILQLVKAGAIGSGLLDARNPLFHPR
jgi:hypothetical protein